MGQLVRFLIILFALWLVLHMVRRFLRRHTHDSGTPPSIGHAPMVACAHCGVHLPETLAVRVEGKAYCSAAHRDAAKNSG